MSPILKTLLLFAEGESIDRIYFVESGSLAISHAEARSSAYANAQVGLLGLAGVGQYPATATWVTQGSCCTISTAALETLQSSHPEILLRLHRQLAKLLSDALRNLDDTALALERCFSNATSPSCGECGAGTGTPGPFDPENLQFLRLLKFFDAFTDDEIGTFATELRQWRIQRGRALFTGRAARRIVLLDSSLVA